MAQRVINMQHTLRKSQLNLSFADPKGASAAKTSQLQYPQHYTQQGYGAYQHQYNYGQYAAHYGQTAYAIQPQVSTGYSYDAYAAASNPQSSASYDRSYIDGRTHPQQPQYAPSPKQQVCVCVCMRACMHACVHEWMGCSSIRMYYLH